MTYFCDSTHSFRDTMFQIDDLENLGQGHEVLHSHLHTHTHTARDYRQNLQNSLLKTERTTAV